MCDRCVYFWHSVLQKHMHCAIEVSELALWLYWSMKMLWQCYSMCRSLESSLDTGVTVVLCSSTLIHFGISCSYLLVRVCLCVVLVAIESAFLHNLWIQLEHAGTGNPSWRFKLLHFSPQNCNFSRQLTYRETTQVDLPSLMSQKEVIAQLYHSSCVSKHDLLHCCYISFLASNYRLNIVKLGDMISNHGFYRGSDVQDFQLLK